MYQFINRVIDFIGKALIFGKLVLLSVVNGSTKLMTILCSMKNYSLGVFNQYLTDMLLSVIEK